MTLSPLENPFGIEKSLGGFGGWDILKICAWCTSGAYCISPPLLVQNICFPLESLQELEFEKMFL